jgi:hypothetical protein
MRTDPAGCVAVGLDGTDFAPWIDMFASYWLAVLALLVLRHELGGSERAPQGSR